MASLEGQATDEDKEKCFICKTLPPKLHCNTCRIDLCSVCVGEHTTSQLNIYHSITSLELRDTSIKHPDCTSHVNFSCELFCEDCSVPVCSQCCTEIHQGHQVTDITDLYNFKQRVIQHDIEISEKLILPKYEQIITDIKSRIADFQRECQNLRKSVSKQCEIWHNEIDDLTSKFQDIINKIEMENIAALKQQLSDIQNLSLLVHKTRQDDINILDSKDGKNLLKHKSKSEEMKIIPQICHISPPTFQPHENKFEMLYHRFGTLTNSIKSYTEGYTLKIQVGTPEEVSSIDTKHKELRRVGCVNPKQAWICFRSEEISCIDIHGTLLDTVNIKHGSQVKDLTTTKYGHLVFTVFGFNTVYLLKHGKIEAITPLYGWLSRGVCSTSDGGFMVCLANGKNRKVVRYYGCTAKQEIEFDTNKHLCDKNYLFVTENTNKDIWLSDYDAKAILVTNQSGKFKFKYTGNLESKKYQTFLPYCIDSDSQGNVLVVDIDNNCIHVIDDEGHLLCYIENLSFPGGLSVDSNDSVWIAEYYGNIKIVKYLKY